jgi:hypothetical protein
MKVARKYEEGVELHQSYIDILLRLAGYRLSDLSVRVLAYSSFYGTINKEIKDELATKNNTSIQVISNVITKLRKLKLLEKNIVNSRLRLSNKENASITLLLTIEKNKVEVPQGS